MYKLEICISRCVCRFLSLSLFTFTDRKLSHLSLSCLFSLSLLLLLLPLLFGIVLFDRSNFHLPHSTSSYKFLIFIYLEYLASCSCLESGGWRILSHCCATQLASCLSCQCEVVVVLVSPILELVSHFWLLQAVNCQPGERPQAMNSHHQSIYRKRRF